MYATSRYTRPHSYHQTQYTPSPTKYTTYDNYASPVKATEYHARSYADYYPSPSSPTYYNQQQHEPYHSGASTASSSSQEGPFYSEELDELDEYNMGMASADMTTIPTVPTPMTLSKYELGKTPSGRVLVTPGNQTVEFFSCAVNAPLARCMIVHE
ncbi:hypothetical protein PsorP6_017573 [Peronosclerospora sorghi]|uniref:Uncharacterized protein n=1 Tax=Peronosclerospora sorghi TaxID=230839 RepID=A0ACC0WMH9_9STRA|nr:hypothetical protein PsorP6_017573 [Peronosclerospora sorghi]